MSFSQLQIIRALADALSNFEEGAVWNAKAAELRRLAGRVGKLYAAMVTRGQIEAAPAGYDVIGADRQRISVKTINGSSRVLLSKRRLSASDYVMIIRVDVSGGEASIEELFRGTIEELKPLCTETDSDLHFITHGRHDAERYV